MTVARATMRPDSIVHPDQLTWRLRLLGSLVFRELSGRYQATLFGWLWPLLVQLAQLLVFTYLFAAIFHVRLVITGVSNPALAYGLWLFIGLLTWNALQIGTSVAANSIIGQPNLIKRVVFPVALLPLVPVCAAFVEALGGLLVTLAIMPLIGAPYRPSLFLLPVIYAFVLILACGLGYLFSAVTVFLRDLPQILNPLFLFAFYLTPIVYPDRGIPAAARFWLGLNPMAIAVQAVRDCVLGDPLPGKRKLAFFAVVCLAVFVIGVRVFRKLRPIFADVV